MTVEFSKLTENARALYDASNGRTTHRPAMEALKQFWAAEVIKAESNEGNLIGVFFGDERVIETIATTRAKRPKVMTIRIDESGEFEDIECLTMLCETIKGSCCYP
jgi:hypothetical protein